MVGLALFVATVAAQAGQACLHEGQELDDQRQRRLAALVAVRTVNSEQSEKFEAKGEYSSDADPGAATLPAGFEYHFARGLDGKSYLLAVKDTVDPCGFAYFSDQAGVIFEAHPLTRR